jgi:hypothetical protein
MVLKRELYTWQPRCVRQASVKSELGLIYATLSHRRLARKRGGQELFTATSVRFRASPYILLSNIPYIKKVLIFSINSIQSGLAY